MGIRITTDERGIKVWKSDRYERPSYSVQISKRDGDGWINHYQPVRFRQGVDVPNGALIHIKNAFPTLDTWVADDKQYKREVWMIMDFSLQGEYTRVEPSDMPDSFAAAEDEVPF